MTDQDPCADTMIEGRTKGVTRRLYKTNLKRYGKWLGQNFEGEDLVEDDGTPKYPDAAHSDKIKRFLFETTKIK